MRIKTVDVALDLLVLFDVVGVLGKLALCVPCGPLSVQLADQLGVQQAAQQGGPEVLVLEVQHVGLGAFYAPPVALAVGLIHQAGVDKP